MINTSDRNDTVAMQRGPQPTGFLFNLINRPTTRRGELRIGDRALSAIPDTRVETEDEMIDRLDANIGAERLARGYAYGRQSARFDMYFDHVLPRRQYREANA